MPHPNSPERIKQAVVVLHHGGVVAYPTEGVYGLGCDPFNAKAVNKVLRLKKRESSKGLLLLAANIDFLLPFLGPLSPEKLQTLKGPALHPITWLVPKSGQVPLWISGAHSTVGVRITQHPLAKALSASFGGPIVSTSANLANQPPLKTAEAVERSFKGEIDFILPGKIGDLKGPTEIRDLISGKIIRPA